MFPSAVVKRMGLASAGACVGAMLASAASAQSTTPVSPRAIGPAAPTATQIGGLVTRPIATAPTTSGRSLYRRVGVPLPVIDAPRTNSGVVTRDQSADEAWAPAVRWVATGDRPRWRRDSSVTPVDAWRDLIVSDVVCNGAGVCRERQQRIRARWIPSCGCYAFADAWNRLWRWITPLRITNPFACCSCMCRSRR